ncbi:hypothetical protein D3C83_190680 [compost metagenome]
MTSKRPALSPGISEPNSVSTPSISGTPIVASTARAISSALPTTMASIDMSECETMRVS